MTDLSSAIVAKSDQLNAEDLLAGPRTITIERVIKKSTADQPVWIHFEGDDGKPYKPCKSMLKVMVAFWGKDGSRYKGRQLTLFLDPKVKWGGMEVGGIRISHMSHIDGPKMIALTVTRGNKKPYTVKPIVAGAEAQQSAAPERESAPPIDDQSSPPPDSDSAAPDDGFPGDKPRFQFSVKASNGDIRNTTDSELWAKTLEAMLRKATDKDAAQAVWNANREYIDAAEKGGFIHFAQRVWVAATQRGVEVE